MLVTPVSQTVKTRGLWFEASPDISRRLYLKNKLKKQKEWDCGSNGRALSKKIEASTARNKQSPVLQEFNPQYCKK
jgi:hypothetical protein